MIKKQTLELTWTGKENRPRLEPRIVNEPAKDSHPATSPGSKLESFVIRFNDAPNTP